MKALLGIIYFFALTAFTTQPVHEPAGISEFVTISKPVSDCIITATSSSSGTSNFTAISDSEAVHFSSVTIKSTVGKIRTIDNVSNADGFQPARNEGASPKIQNGISSRFRFHPLALKIIFPQHYFW